MKIIAFFFVIFLSCSVWPQESKSEWSALLWKLYSLNKGPQTAVDASELKADALCFQHLKEWPREGRKGDVFFLARATLYALNQDLSQVADLDLLLDQWSSLIKIPAGDKVPSPQELQKNYSKRLTYQFSLRHQAISGMGSLCLALPKNKQDLLKTCKGTLKGVSQRDWVAANRLLALLYFLSMEKDAKQRTRVLQEFIKNDGQVYFVTGKNHWTGLVKGAFIKARDSSGTPRFDYTLADDKQDLAIGSVSELDVFYHKDIQRREEMLKDLSHPQTDLSKRWLALEIEQMKKDKNTLEKACQGSVEEACQALQSLNLHDQEVNKVHLPLGLMHSLDRDTQKIKNQNPLDQYPPERKIRMRAQRNRNFAKNIDPNGNIGKALFEDAKKKNLFLAGVTGVQSP